jgi:hypothetical protein
MLYLDGSAPVLAYDFESNRSSEMNPTPTNVAPWAKSFIITQQGDDPALPGGIVLEQIDSKQFALRSCVRFTGITGLEGRIPGDQIEVIRTVTPATIGGTTDLASVPTPLQWLVSRYGAHTPAALIHDRFIGMSKEEKELVGVSELNDAYTDRYFRFMLEAIGVRWLRRWMMWAAVALRTRWASGWIRRVMLTIWLIASVTGIGVSLVGIATGNWWWVVAASLAPLLFGLLWDRQYGAGLVAAYTAIWVLPPTILGSLGFLVYRVLEGVAAKVRGRNTARMQPNSYSEF